MFEYSTLGWVKPQLDDVLSDAQLNLNEYIENGSHERLRKCIEHLQLIYGTLQMVEVFGASMLAEEMQHTSEALLEGNVTDANTTYDVLMRAMLQMPDYLESIQAGCRDNPITLMPLMNDLRAVRKQNLLTQGVLFSPDIENTQLFSDDYDADAIKPGKLQGEVKRLRTHYQLGLLDYIRNNKETAGLHRIRAVLTSLEKVSANAEVRRIWMVVGALVEGLLKNGIDKNSSVEMLLGAVDRQLKLILECGEDKYPSQYSKGLVSNALFYIALSTLDTRSISAVKEAYNLNDLIAYGAEQSDVAISGLNADLFGTVSNGITEDMDQVKDELELFMHSSEQNVEQLVPVVEQLGKIADTYGMLGIDAVRQSLMGQRDVLQGIINGDIEVGEQVVLGIASEVLKAESELKDYIAERSGIADRVSASAGLRVPAAEYRQVVHTVASEALKNFSEAKAAILAYVSGNGGTEQLDIVLNRLEEVSGITMLLPLDRVAALIKKLQSFIRIALLNNNHQATEEEQDAIADVVTSIEYYIESLLEGRPGVEQGLDAGDKAISKLELKTRYYGGGEPDISVADRDDATVGGSNTEKAEVIELTVAEAEVESKLIRDESAVIPQTAEQFTILANDADEEIVEIFIEEADEVLAEMREYLPQWRANVGNDEALEAVRRGFHTLKGSGRLSGAELMGEFSWKFENMLNRLIDNKIEISDALYQALDDALAVLPDLIEQIKGSPQSIDNIFQLMSAADALAEGREVTFNSPDPAIDSKAVEAGMANPVEVTEVRDTADTGVTAGLNDTGKAAGAVEGTDFEFVEPEAENTITIDELEADDSVGLDDFFDIADEVDAVSVNDADIVNTAEELAEEAFTLKPEEVDEEDFAIEAANADDDDIDSIQDIVIQDVDAIDENIDELIELSGIDEISGNYDIDEDANLGNAMDDAIGIDPVLLKIYFDESLGHIKTVKQLIDECNSEKQRLKADKELLRAFHTLYGSARTARVEAIAELAGATEKYIKARQDNDKKFIPDDVTAVITDVQYAISAMLKIVADGRLPVSDKGLHEKINNILQLELGNQSQKSDQQNVEMAEGYSLPEKDESQPVQREALQVSYGDVDDELINIFLEEATELLESSEDTLSKIRNEPDPAAYIHQLQRNMHTLKGGARMADLAPVGDLTHNLESLVDRINDNRVNFDNACFDLLQESLDTLTAMLGAVKNRQPLPFSGGLINCIEGLIRSDAEDKKPVEHVVAEPGGKEHVDIERAVEMDFSVQLPEYEVAADNKQDRIAPQERSDKQQDNIALGRAVDQLPEKEKQRKEDKD
ncbi:MAG: Hpt domain-containing protein, partial [Gammaproteobacteria bacterium]|nr:Hpt domain-containing protein [Gammaproteobacteria bacterium]